MLSYQISPPNGNRGRGGAIISLIYVLQWNQKYALHAENIVKMLLLISGKKNATSKYSIPFVKAFGFVGEI